MRIVHVSYFYGTAKPLGAPIAATRLHQALLRAGHDSHFVCFDALESGTNVHVLPLSWGVRALFYLAVRVSWIVSRIFAGKVRMLNWLPLPGFCRVLQSLSPDIVHVHFAFQDFVSLEQLSKIPGRLVISLHDLMFVNLVDIHPCSDRRFIDGVSSANASVLERWMFKRKQSLAKMKHPVFVGPSQWVCSMAQRSIIARDCICHVVPNVVDPLFSYRKTEFKKHSRFVVLFGAAGGRTSANKGWKDFVRALDLVPADVKREMEVLVFGERALGLDVSGVPVRFLGTITSQETLCDTYNKGDLFVFPSLCETLGQTKVEALLCGLPVVAFDRTACAELIDHGKNGWVAANGNYEQFAEGLCFFYKMFEEGRLSALRLRIAKGIRCKLSEKEIVRKTLQAYSAD